MPDDGVEGDPGVALAGLPEDEDEDAGVLEDGVEGDPGVVLADTPGDATEDALAAGAKAVGHVQLHCSTHIQS